MCDGTHHNPLGFVSTGINEAAGIRHKNQYLFMVYAYVYIQYLP